MRNLDSAAAAATAARTELTSGLPRGQQHSLQVLRRRYDHQGSGGRKQGLSLPPSKGAHLRRSERLPEGGEL